jgi:S1-C subfamily serine protease
VRLASLARAGALLGVLPLAACSIVPAPPEGLPEDWVPSISPSPLDEGLLDSPLGFAPEEQSAVRIRAAVCGGLSLGTGFILDAHTIVTNQHVIDGYLAIEVTTADGRDISVDSAAISLPYLGPDIGIVTSVEALEPAAPLADEDPRLGDFVTVVGYPGAEELTTTSGTVLTRMADEFASADHVFMISAKVEDGSSGSAAYNEEGRVFGVVYAGLEDGSGFGEIIPISIVRDALDHLEPIDPAPACVD